MSTTPTEGTNWPCKRVRSVWKRRGTPPTATAERWLVIALATSSRSPTGRLHPAPGIESGTPARSKAELQLPPGVVRGDLLVPTCETPRLGERSPRGEARTSRALQGFDPLGQGTLLRTWQVRRPVAAPVGLDEF